MDQITEIFTYFAVTSVAAERLVDVLKRLGLGKFNLNGVVYQLISALFGAALAYYSPPDLPVAKVNEWVLAIITGLAVSGGSSVWNNALEALAAYTKSVKALKA